MIARIEPVTQGTIRFDGDTIDSLAGEQLRLLGQKMQIIFQEPLTSFSPRMKIGTFLQEPFINYNNLSKKEASNKAAQLLESVELPVDYINRYPHQLSGGEQQRVVIARAIALNPLLLICDEPSSALDVSIQKRVLDMLDNMRRKNNIAMLFISHDLALVSAYCDWIVVMYLGHILESAPAKTFSREAEHPYTQMLLQSVFHMSKEQGEPIPLLEGEPPSPTIITHGCPFSSRCSYTEERCIHVTPALHEITPGHMVACHLR